MCVSDLVAGAIPDVEEWAVVGAQRAVVGLARAEVEALVQPGLVALAVVQRGDARRWAVRAVGVIKAATCSVTLLGAPPVSNPLGVAISEWRGGVERAEIAVGEVAFTKVIVADFIAGSVADHGRCALGNMRFAAVS